MMGRQDRFHLGDWVGSSASLQGDGAGIITGTDVASVLLALLRPPTADLLLVFILRAGMYFMLILKLDKITIRAKTVISEVEEKKRASRDNEQSGTTQADFEFILQGPGTGAVVDNDVDFYQARSRAIVSYGRFVSHEA